MDIDNQEIEARSTQSFYMVPNVILYDRRLDCDAKCVYQLLIHRSMQKGICWPSINSIALDLNLSPRHVRNKIKELAEYGLIDIEHRYDEEKKTNSTNVFKIIQPNKIYGDVLVWQGFPKHEDITAVVTKNGGGTAQHTVGVLHSMQGVLHSMQPNKEEAKKKEREEKERKQKNLSTPARLPSVAGRVSYTSADLELAKKWYEFAVKEMKWRKPPPSWSEEQFAASINRIQKVMKKISLDMLWGIFDFIQKDPFWRMNVLSPNSLLNNSSDGKKKIDNIMLKIKGGFNTKIDQMEESIDEFIASLGDNK